MHHGDELPREMLESLWPKFAAKDGRPTHDFGATGRFPEGRLNKDDEGEICFGVSHDPVTAKVIINFGKPVAWVGMSQAQAVDLANGLLKHSRDCRLLTRRRPSACTATTKQEAPDADKQDPGAG